jgi:two-component system, sensor histidine kinase and response regulator
MNDSPDRKRIFLIDDDPQTLEIAGGALEEAGYTALFCQEGRQALLLAEVESPDLILLDLMLPGIDGLEVCAKLKARAATKDIPVIFLTATHDKSRILEAFRLGAVDYVTKPFLPAELIARVGLHLDLKASKDRLLRINAEKTFLMSMVAHDLKNPLSSIMLSACMLADRESPLDSERVARLGEALEINAKRMSALINNLLFIEALETGQREFIWGKIDLRQCLKTVVDQLRPSATKKGIILEDNLSLEPLEGIMDIETLRQIAENLISNAIKFSPSGKTVTVYLLPDGPQHQLTVRDQGPGIRPDEMPRLYTKFTRLSAVPTGGESCNGVGLSIVKLLVEAAQGTILCQSLPGRGTHFTVNLPISRPA